MSKQTQVFLVATMLLTTAIARSEPITEGQALTHFEYEGLLGTPRPSTISWQYGTAGDVLPRISLTINNVMPLWTWDGTTWLNPDNPGPGWVPTPNSANALATLTITQSNAAIYGLDWLAYQAAVMNPLYDRRYLDFGSFEQMRLYSKLSTSPPGTPGYDVLYQNFTLSTLTITLQYGSYSPPQMIAHFGKQYLSDGLFSLQGEMAGDGTIVLIQHTPEPASAWLLMVGVVGLVALAGGQRRMKKAATESAR